jgi:cell fate (sporulation/competence/biofilm development) regulator YlbF (YheA/YmcA/DUF963 family)
MADDLQPILEAATKLGEMLAQHPAVARYRSAQKSVADDPETSRLLQEFDKQLETLARQEASGMPVTDAQRSTIESIQTRLMSNLKMKAFQIAQVEFTDLLRKVSQAWQKPLAGAGGLGGVSAGGSAGPRGGISTLS